MTDTNIRSNDNKNSTSLNKPLYREVKISPVRIIAMTLLLFALVSLSLYLFCTALSDLYDNLMIDLEYTKSGKIYKGWQGPVSWCVRELSFWLPMILICIFQYAVYHRYNRHDGILQKEMAIEILLVGLLVYAVLLPTVAVMSRQLYDAAVAAGETIPLYKFTPEGSTSVQTGGPITLMTETFEWFIRFIIPVGFLSLYHFARAKRETEESNKNN